MQQISSGSFKKGLAFLISFFLLILLHAQNAGSKKEYKIVFDLVDKDNAFNLRAIKLQTDFNGQTKALTYMQQLPDLLVSKGFPAASLDSISLSDTAAYIKLYLGNKFNWVRLRMHQVEKKALDFTGFQERNFQDKPLNLFQMKNLQQRLLRYYESNGYPFATVRFDSMFVTNNQINAVVTVEKGPLYFIDSIRVIGKADISDRFLQHYLSIPNHSAYSISKLEDIDKRILELPYVKAVQPSDCTMLGSGAVVNLYVQPKKSSQVNFLIGFLPAETNTGKLQVTGDVNLDLKNMFGSGERLLLKWQQLQPKSPRLNIGINRPYIFNSAVGLEVMFDLFKKDSNFLQINAQAGLQYMLTSSQFGKIYFQWQQTSLLSGAVDTVQIKSDKKLPPNTDVSSMNTGIEYVWNKTNYRFNPRKGNEFALNGSIGIKNIQPNSEIQNIKDPTFDYASLYDSLKLRSYQLRIKMGITHFFPIGKSATLKTTFNTALYNSPVIFRNDLFQIGGYKLLRGFDEEGIYATKYGVFSLEYRLLLALNSYLCFFSDAGITQNKYQTVNLCNRYLGVGMGMVYETKLGLLNLNLAMGKRDHVAFNIREAVKIHFGYINYF